MRVGLGVFGIVLIVTGCALNPPPVGQPVTGEVWGWDTQTGTVMLKDDSGKNVRVKVSPDQFRTLRVNQRTTLYGQLAPVEIEHITSPSQPMTARPMGAPDQFETTGTIASISPTGKMEVRSSRGSFDLLVPPGTEQRFTVGAPVRVRVSVQPVRMVPAQTAVAPAPDPSAVAQREPGEYAVVIGRVLQVDPAGAVQVEAPGGAIRVLVPDAKRYQADDSVEVRTSVHQAQ
jgi:hypothetical protein